MKESKYSVLPQPIFRETFTDEQSCQGTPTAVTFQNGAAVCVTANNSKIYYPKKSFNGIYTVRLRLASYTPVLTDTRLFIDFRGISGTGVGSLSANTTNTLIITSGTSYIDGIASSALSANTKEIVVSGMTINTNEIYLNIRYSGSNVATATYELFEIYQGTLSAETVKLLYSNSNYLPDDQRHIKRVVDDGGTVRTISNVTAFERMCKRNKMWNNIRFAWTGETGGKTVVNGIYQNFSNLYSVKGVTDAVQATAGSRPYLSGNIAPNERYGMLNPNGGGRNVTHPTISFAATDPWTVTCVMNWSGTNSNNASFVRNTAIDGGLHLRNTTFKYSFRENFSPFTFRTFTNTNTQIIGKTTILTFVASGATTLSLYVNGVFSETISCTTNMTFDQFIKGYSSAGYEYFGKYFAHIIRSGALTAAQVLAEATFLRSIYPEIPTVQIGTQEWATSNLDVVCTPQGNVINEITDNSNLENIINGNFTSAKNNSDTGNHTSAIVSDSELSSNVLEVTATGAGANNTNSIYWGGVGTNIIVNPTSWVNKYIKFSVKAKTISGNTTLNIQNSSGLLIGTVTLTSTWSTYTFWYKQGSGGSALILMMGGAGVCRIEDISQQLVGWSGLTEVYSSVFTSTAGTTAQKTTAAQLAAAAWCHHTNDSANGVIYGKLYNKYAQLVLKDDIAAYNLANPTATWGYHVGTEAELTTLSAYGGNALKKEGTNYSQTAGGTNATGFTGLLGAKRNADGTFATIKQTMYAICADSSKALKLEHDNNNATIVAIDPLEGCSIRLKKD